MSNGMIVKHSHPFNHHPEDGQQHQHSQKEFSYYHGFCLDYFENADSVLEQKINVNSENISDGIIIATYCNKQINTPLLRGPPSFPYI